MTLGYRAENPRVSLDYENGCHITDRLSVAPVQKSIISFDYRDNRSRR